MSDKTKPPKPDDNGGLKANEQQAKNWKKHNAS